MTFLKTIRAEAHCDIPCGIYDPTPAKIAAKTVARMIDQLDELATPADMSDKHAIISYSNSISRRIVAKETHAELCKRELAVLWSDFFKPEHVAKYPNLHDIFWKAMKLCSKTKQGPNTEDAVALAAAIDEIARIFYEMKGAPEKYEAYKKITDTLY